MCGRTACTLSPDNLVKACGFRDKRGRYRRPAWKDPPGGQQYYPSYNVAPASHTPVLFSSKHCTEEVQACSERVIQPMKWGLVPAWHKGDPYKLEYETNNCRAEGMLTKRTYKNPLEKGNRCVILADGFFEWKRTKEGKQPYFIYFGDSSPEKTAVKSEIKEELKTESNNPDPPFSTQNEDAPNHVQIKPDPDFIQQEKKNEDALVELKPEPSSSASGQLKSKQLIKSEDILQKSAGELKTESDTGDTGRNTKQEISFDGTSEKNAQLADGGSCSTIKREDDLLEDEEYTGKRLLTMAGVFDAWYPPDGSPPLYSYSVITVESSPAMTSIHHRMPAILSTEEEINDWLDFAEVPLAKAAKIIQPKECIAMHMVSPIVNNSRNKSPECIEPYEPKPAKKSASSNMMMNWLGKAKASPEKQSPDAKKPKLQ